MTKGFIFKYSADADDPLLRDKLGTTSVCGVELRDPDFWSNACPVWAICGPYYREALDPGDFVFFLPKQTAIRKAKLDDYICTGVLVVQERLPGPEFVMTDTRLTKEYKKRYNVDLAAHLKTDKARTRKIRPCNFIVGNSSKSKWFGRNKRHLRTMLQELGIQNVRTKISARRISALSQVDARSLYHRLLGRTPSA